MNKFVIVLLAAAAGAAWGQDGHEIMAEVQKRAHSTSMRYEGTLYSCTSPKGCPPNSKALVTKRWVYERLGDFGNSKGVLRFTGPAEVKGVALLIVNHPDAASDQWLWRPAVGREQKVAVQDRSTRFFGTDFSFEDLEERDADQYTYTIDGQMNGQWKIDAKPKKASDYTHCYFYIDKTNYTFMRIEAYNKKGFAKAIDYTDFEMVKGIWTARSVEVVDIVRKTRTALHYDKVDYNLPLKPEDFTVEALRIGQ
jgi:hypothetical protein